MPSYCDMPEYDELCRRILMGMDNFKELSPEESLIQPLIYNHVDGSHFQNIHRIPLDANLNAWNNGVWMILKPRFFNSFMQFEKTKLNAIIRAIQGRGGRRTFISNDLISHSLALGVNDIPFIVFIMIKRMKEVLEVTDPSDVLDETRESTHRQVALNPIESALQGSLFPFEIDNLSITGPEFTLDVTPVLDYLQQIIANVMINSSLQRLAFVDGMMKMVPQPAMAWQRQGICFLNQKDLNHLSEPILSIRPKAVLVNQWLSRTDSCLSNILSQLLNALLETPPNINTFLDALNLDSASVERALCHIATQENVRVERIKKIDGLLMDLSIKITSLNTNKAYQQAANELVLVLNNNFERFKNNQINSCDFIKFASDSICIAQIVFIKDPTWSQYLKNLLKNIVNQCVSFLRGGSNHSNHFFPHDYSAEYTSVGNFETAMRDTFK